MDISPNELKMICYMLECIKSVDKINLKRILKSKVIVDRNVCSIIEESNKYIILELILQNDKKMNVMKILDELLEAIETLDLLCYLQIDLKFNTILLDEHANVYLDDIFNIMKKEDNEKNIKEKLTEIMNEIIKYINNDEERNIFNKILENKEEMLLEEIRLILNSEMNINEEITMIGGFFKTKMSDYYYENYHPICNEVKTKIHDIIMKGHTQFGFNNCIYIIYD